MEGIMKYAVEMASGGMIYIPSFVTICSGIQVMLRLLPQQFKSCSVGIIDEREL
jgi:hypothetical protein